MRITIKSDITGKTYTGDNVEELMAQCKADDKSYEKAKAEEKAVKEKKPTEVSKLKKELSKSVDSAKDKLVEARKAYDNAKNQAAEKVNAVNEEVKKLLDEAKKAYNEAQAVARKKLDDSDKEISEFLAPYETAIRDAEKEKYEAVLKFTEKFGPYQVVYTGDKAKQEYQKIKKEMDDMFNSFNTRFFDNFSWDFPFLRF